MVKTHLCQCPTTMGIVHASLEYCGNVTRNIQGMQRLSAQLEDHRTAQALYNIQPAMPAMQINKKLSLSTTHCYSCRDVFDETKRYQKQKFDAKSWEAVKNNRYGSSTVEPLGPKSLPDGQTAWEVSKYNPYSRPILEWSVSNNEHDRMTKNSEGSAQAFCKGWPPLRSASFRSLMLPFPIKTDSMPQ